MLIRPDKSRVIYMSARFFIPAGVVLAFLIHQLSAAGSNPANYALLAIVLLGPPILYVWTAMSQQIEVTDKEITRRGLFGTNRMAMSDVLSAHMVSGGRGSRMLSVQSEREKLVISTLMFSHAQLEQVQNFVVEAAHKTGRAIPASQPPKALTHAGSTVVLALSIAGAVLAIVLVVTLTR
jgi:hypothetical protein